jgi:hypothetical protein
MIKAQMNRRSRNTMSDEQEFITASEARKRLGNISQWKLAALFSSGTLPWYPNVLDHRSKLVRVSELEDLIRHGAVAPKYTKRATA